MSDPRAKRLNEMDDLRDMGHFPLPIYVGATGNVLMTILLTYVLRGRGGGPLVLPAWAGGVISANILPVVVLRSRMDENTDYPEIGEMGFVGDQHKFSSPTTRWPRRTCSSGSCSPGASFRCGETARRSPACSSSPSSVPFSRRG